MNANPRIMELSRMSDQRQAILDVIIPALADIHPIYGNDVLTATYIEPEVTSGGIYLPDSRVNESIYQGKVGLVLLLGIDAFKYRDGFAFFSRFDGEDDEAYNKRIRELIPKQGEWVFYRPIGNLWKCTIKGFACQFVKDSEIKGRIINPKAIF